MTRPDYHPGTDPLDVYPPHQGADDPWGWADSPRRRRARLLRDAKERDDGTDRAM